MINLLNNYSIGEIILFVIILALAVKEFLTLFDFFVKKLDDKFSGKYKSKEEQIELQETIEEFKNTLDEIKSLQKKNEEMIAILVASDIEDIRSWVVRQYHYFKNNTELKLDDFEMDCIEKRFQCYQKEGGNSYIHDLVKELREIHNERM